MKRNHLAKKINKVLFYGWVIIAFSALATFFSSPGQTYSISAFIDSYIEEFGFSRTLISTIYSVATVISGTLLVFMGKAVDRFGQRIMLIIAGIMLSLACLFNSFIINIPMIFFGFFFLRYFGQGSLSLIPGSLVPQWFVKHRALAISLLSLGNIVGNMLAPRINIYFITTYGWNTAWRVWSLLLIVLFVPLMWIFIVNKPENIGLLPDNSPVKSQLDIDNELELTALSSFTLNGALKTKEFWFVGIISMISPMISTGMMFHMYSILSGKGISATSTAGIIGLVALPGLIMPIIASTIIDKFRSKYIIFTTLLFIALDLVLMLFVNSIIMASIFLIIYGFFSNVQNITLNVIWVRYFGRLHLGSIRGAATVFSVIGSAFGTVPFGLSYDMTGSYANAFIGMAIATCIGMVMALSIKKPKKA